MFSLIYISKFTLEFVCLCCYVFGEPMKSQQNVDTLSALFSSNRQFFSCTDDRLELLLFRLLLFYLDFLFQQVHITCRRKTRMMNSTSKPPQNLLLNNISYPNYQVFSVNSSTFKPNWKTLHLLRTLNFHSLATLILCSFILEISYAHHFMPKLYLSILQIIAQTTHPPKTFKLQDQIKSNL